MKRLVVVAALAGCFPHHLIARNFTLAGEGTVSLAGLGVAIFARPHTSCTSPIDTDDHFTVGGLCHTTDPSSLGVPLIAMGALAVLITYVSWRVHEPPPAAKPAAPVRSVGRLGDDPTIGLVEAFAAAHEFATMHSVHIPDSELRGTHFDIVARQWVFEWTGVTITVHESGRVEMLVP